MVLPRVLTAVLAAPLFLWVVYWGGVPYAVFIFFLVTLAIWEYHRMAEDGGHQSQGVWGVAAGIVLFFAVAYAGFKPKVNFALQAPAMTITVLVFILVMREFIRRDKSLAMLRLSTSLLGLFFVVWPLSHLVLLREMRGEFIGATSMWVGRDATFFLIFIIWAQDIAAWAVGRSIGKHRLSPAVSPGKSWEGAVAGLAAALLCAFIIRELFMKYLFNRMECLAVAFFIGILGQISDLVESLMKRSFGVKDSSQLLPGHGGVLDRFDSFLFTAPCLFYYLNLMGKGR